MVEKAVSPEHEDEVLDLLDIVQPAETLDSEGEEEIIELSVEDIADQAKDYLSEAEDELLELVDVVKQGEYPQEDSDALLLTDRLELPGEEESAAVASTENSAGPAAVDAVETEEATEEPRPSYVEEASFQLFCEEVEARLAAVEQARQAEAQASEERFAALCSAQDEGTKAFHERVASVQLACASELQAMRAEFNSSKEERGVTSSEVAQWTSAFEERLASLEDAHAAQLQALEARFVALEEKHEAEMHVIEARIVELEEKYAADIQTVQAGLAAAEERASALESALSALRNDLSECPSAVIADTSFHQALEEMVGVMIEARLAERAAAEMQEEKVESDSALQAFAECIDTFTVKLDEMQSRVDSWEARCEQEASLAAARVIREEIAAMRAGAARMAH